MPADGHHEPPLRGRPFNKGQSGNPAGRPKGARNRTTLALEAMLEGEAEVITRKWIELAQAGDLAAIKLAVDRVLPARRERLIEFPIPQLTSAADAVAATAAIIEGASSGNITIGEAVELTKILVTVVKRAKEKLKK